MRYVLAEYVAPLVVFVWMLVVLYAALVVAGAAQA